MATDLEGESRQALMSMIISFSEEETFAKKDLEEIEDHEVEMPIPMFPPNDENLEVLKEKGYIEETSYGVYTWTEEMKEDDIWSELENIDPKVRDVEEVHSLESGSMTTTAGEYGAEIDERQFTEGEVEIFRDKNGNQGIRLEISGGSFRNKATMEGILGEDITDLVED